jgi:cytoskeletal protein CcmA (bactofilin family)
MLITRTHGDHATRRDANSSAKPGPTIISADLAVVGDISTPGEVQLEGKVLGDVHCSHLTIGPTGRVEGDVFAEHVAVFGEIAGKVSARDVFVTATGKVDGGLIVENLAVEPGGHFEGHCTRAEAGTYAAKAANGQKPAALVQAAE